MDYEIDYFEGIVSERKKLNEKTVFPIDKGDDLVGYTCEIKYYKVINMYEENLFYLLMQKKISFPIKIIALEKQRALIIDERVPNKYYTDGFILEYMPSELILKKKELHKIFSEEYYGKIKEETA